MQILLGSIVLETFMIYPNVFHDPPASFTTALAFMSIAAPSDFFPPLGLACWMTGALAVILGWRVPPARYWLVGGVFMIACEGLMSIVWLWPRNQVMFVEGAAVHSAEVLRRTAAEFQALDWWRVAFNTVGSTFAFVGFVRCYRFILTR